MEVKRGGKRKGAGRKKADYKTKTMVEKMNNATKKDVKAMKITSVDMETVYFDMNGVECATDLSMFAEWVQEEIGNIEISQDYLNPVDGHSTIETVYSAWEWIYEMVQEAKLNEVFFHDYLKLPKTIER